jgi:hypothetical protein
MTGGEQGTGNGELHDGVSCDALVIDHDEGVDALFWIGVEMGRGAGVVRSGRGGCLGSRVHESGWKGGPWIK